MSFSVSTDLIKNDLLLTKMYVNPWFKMTKLQRFIANVLCNHNLKRVILTMPAQFGKTEMVSKTYPAYALARWPEKSRIIACYNEEYANKVSVQCRDFFKNPKFQQLFSYDMHPQLDTKHEWRLKKYPGGNIFTGVGGSATGNPADEIIIDDPIKNFEDAISSVMQAKIWQWYETVLKTRLQSEDSRIFIIMTRWVKNDLVGRIQRMEEERNIKKENRFLVINIPAIWKCKNPADLTTGQSSCPERKSMKFLLNQFDDSPTTFAAMYQGHPMDLEEALIKEGDFEIITEDELKILGEPKLKCRGWDFAYTTDKSSNYTVGVKINVYGEDYNRPVIVDVKRFKLSPQDAIEKIYQVADEDGTDTSIALETGGTQIAMTDHILSDKRMFDKTTLKIIPDRKKTERAHPWAIRAKDKKFKLLKGIWNNDFLKEAYDFSENCLCDDQMDAVSTAWQALYGKPKNK